MPKDFTGVRPLGVVTRHPADWFSDSLYVAGWQELDQPSGSGEIYFAVALFNNDQGGNVLRVYGANSLSEGGGGCNMYFVHGTTGTLKQTARPIRPDFPIPNVSVYYQFQQVSTGSPNPFAFGDLYGNVSSSGFDSQLTVSPFPLFIVPVGWSLVATNPSSSFLNGFFWWFQLTPQ